MVSRYAARWCLHCRYLIAIKGETGQGGKDKPSKPEWWLPLSVFPWDKHTEMIITGLRNESPSLLKGSCKYTLNVRTVDTRTEVREILTSGYQWYLNMLDQTLCRRVFEFSQENYLPELEIFISTFVWNIANDLKKKKQLEIFLFNPV